MTGESIDPRLRQKLGALRYAVNEDATTYSAIMRLFTSGMSGLMSDQSADEGTERRAALRLVIDRDTVDLRSRTWWNTAILSGARARPKRAAFGSTCSTARYHLKPRGELVHRQVEALVARRAGRRRPERGDHERDRLLKQIEAARPPLAGDGGADQGFIEDRSAAWQLTSKAV
ncbi:hypothetical protein [Paenarthrobacter sp. NPDC090522]|uniref:hypothetical protein n=1 Tax=Paenarthrobacter sp. NPDC090522 TaxID=3364383 RepID=UPI0037FCE4B4